MTEHGSYSCLAVMHFNVESAELNRAITTVIR